MYEVDISDPRFVAAAKDQDAANRNYVFEQISIYCSKMATRIMRKKPYHHSDIEDITQSIVLKVLNNIDKYDMQKSKFSTWLTRVTINACNDFLRKNNRGKARILSDAGVYDENADDDVLGLSTSDPRQTSPLEQALDDDEKQITKYIINGIDRSECPTMIQRVMGLTYEQIATTTNNPTSTLRRRHYQERNRLREKIKEQYQLS